MMSNSGLVNNRPREKSVASSKYCVDKRQTRKRIELTRKARPVSVDWNLSEYFLNSPNI